MSITVKFFDWRVAEKSGDEKKRASIALLRRNDKDRIKRLCATQEQRGAQRVWSGLMLRAPVISLTACGHQVCAFALR
jgi:hypothetical protein